MRDLIKRLRAYPENVLEGAGLCFVAANEIEYLRSQLADADKLILWAIRPSGSGEPVPVMLERCYAWRRKYAKRAVTVDGTPHKRSDRIANCISTYAMYDCHLFRELKGATIEAVIEDWQRECEAPDPRYGAPSLCPVIVLNGKDEIRRVGKMVHLATELPAFRAALLADSDVARLLAERTA